MGIKVVQWAPGKVGAAALRVLITRGDFELAGVYVHSDAKVGVDAGTLCGLNVATGVQATQDVDALLATNADCVFYTPLVPDVDIMVRFLEAGINVVTTSNFFRGDYLDRFGVPDARSRLEAAALRGQASIFGGGYNPGFITQLPLVLASISSQVDLIEIEEAGDITHYESGAFFDMLGWGQPPPAGGDDSQSRPGFAAVMDGFLYDGLDMVAEACRFDVTDRRVTVEYATTAEDLVCPARTFAAGTIAGQRTTWEYLSGDEVVIRMKISWCIGDKLQPNFAVGNGFGRHNMTVHGEPGINLTMAIEAPEGCDPRERMQKGMLATAMSALNAAPYVCAAPPGMRSYLDLPPFPGIAPARLRST